MGKPTEKHTFKTRVYNVVLNRMTSISHWEVVPPLLLLTSYIKYSITTAGKPHSSYKDPGFLATDYCFFLAKQSAGFYANNHIQAMINSEDLLLHRMASLILLNLWICQKKWNYCIQLLKKVPKSNKEQDRRFWVLNRSNYELLMTLPFFSTLNIA